MAVESNAGRVGKISPIPKDYSQSDFLTLDGSLSKHGYTRSPGTGRIFLPYKERSGLYRTGLDVTAPHLKRLKDLSTEQYNAEIERITKDKERLEKALQCVGCLSPDSDLYNFASNAKLKVTPIKLSNDDIHFDLTDPLQEVTWNWLKVYPFIAPSLDAYRRGECASECQYYIADNEAENRIVFSKKKEVNDAIVNFAKLNPTKQKQIGRLMGLPITDHTSMEEVYIQVDNTLKEIEFKSGRNKGTSTVRLFNEIFNLSDDRLKVKDLVEQAISRSIYRVRGSGKIFEGEVEVAKSKDELVSFLLEDENQDDLLTLDKKLKSKKEQEL